VRAVEPARIVADLTDAQRRAVTTDAQPLRILAGAGSGKTRVLTRRIAHRVATDQADPRRVLALTFTRKAAGELRQRLRQLGLRDDVAAGTFHAVALAQLRIRWDDRNERPWEVLDRKGRLVAGLLPAKHRRDGTLPGVVNEIEWAKARMIRPDDYVAAVNASGRRVDVDTSLAAQVFADYETLRRKRRMVDFDDLLRGWQHWLRHDDDFADIQRWRFRHLFVDEFQDVNPLQHAVLEALVDDGDDLCVVGDPAQAIYSWNGADASYLEQFDDHWPGGATVSLVESFRSTPQVLAAAANVLGPLGAGRRLTPTRPDGPPPVVRALADDEDEAQSIARAIRDRSHGRPWSHQAVLVRTNAQTALVERALQRASIPCRVRGGSGLLDRPEVKAVLDDLRRQGGRLDVAIGDLEVEARRVDDAEPVEDPGAGDDPEGRQANLDALVRLARDHSAMAPDATVAGFVATLAAGTSYDGLDRAGDAVEVSTFHAAKGLEWPIVHLAGIEDGLVPVFHARDDPDALDEERRLLYVAVTRAEDELLVSWAKRRTFGSKQVHRSASPWLDALDTTREADERPARLAPRQRGRGRRPGPARGGAKPGTVADLDTDDTVLFESLRQWRSERARAASIPAFTVFQDRTLVEVARRRPASPAELAAVPGIGPVKLRRWSEPLLAIVAEHDAAG
jgi:DNA helicase-2/ATP-dependent DNA helicase PcrA